MSFFGSAIGQYDSVEYLDELPRRSSTTSKIVSHGYAAGLSVRRIGQMWFYFDHLEPALAFGRAARMASAVAGYGVYRAAEQLGSSSPEDAERRLLFVTGGSLDRRPGEVEHLTAWLRGIRPESSHWKPTATSPGLRRRS